MPRRCVPVALLLILSGPLSAADPFAETLGPLLQKNCLDCHSKEKVRGGINLGVSSDEATVRGHARMWRAAVEQIRDGTMPPATRKPLTTAEKTLLIAGLTTILDKRDSRPAVARDPGPALLRRLTRAQYNRTLRDLLAIDLDVAEAVGLPEEVAPTGYATLATALTLPPTLFEKYLAAADRALDVIFTPLKTGPGVPKGARHPGFVRLVTHPDDARACLVAFLPRAFRRPVPATEMERYLGLYERVRQKGETFEVAMRWAACAVLVSPHFLLRVETDSADQTTSARVTDHQLAVRLSYFLQGTMPDAELTALADRGKLTDPETLTAQTNRLLGDPRGQALSEDFLTRWAQLDKLADARPSQEFFPTLTPRLRRAMHDEVFLFLDGLRKEDRSIREVLQADYTYLNQDLARHYDIPGVLGAEMRKVTLKPEWHRGGLATMAASLTSTSHTFRTSPTLRGKWVLDTLLGTPPPPPPPDVGMIDESKAKGASPANFRELLALHASQPTCASCHRRIDPLGFGLENFDAVGRWRSGGTPNRIDASGVLPSGEAFVGPDQLKAVLGKRPDRIVRNLVEQTLIFALGRDLRADDETTILEIVARLDANEYRFSELIHGVVSSQPFQFRRTRSTP